MTITAISTLLRDAGNVGKGIPIPSESIAIILEEVMFVIIRNVVETGATRTYK